MSYNIPISLGWKWTLSSQQKFAGITYCEESTLAVLQSVNLTKAIALQEGCSLFLTWLLMEEI